MKMEERNRLANVYRREADQFGVGSPYRIDEYIKFRFRGMSPEKAIEKVKSKETRPMTMKRKEDMTARRPEIDLTGPDGNVFVLMGFARRWAKDLDLDGPAIQADMTSGDYEHLLEVLEKNFGEYVDFVR